MPNETTTITAEITTQQITATRRLVFIPANNMPGYELVNFRVQHFDGGLVERGWYLVMTYEQKGEDAASQ